MPRETTAYLHDIIDACDSIASIPSGISVETYGSMANCARRDLQ